MKWIINILATALIVYILAYLMPGVSVDSFGSSIVVVLVLSLLNLFLKPIIQIITIPITILTLGIFLFVINAIIVLICSEIVSGFNVNGFLSAIVFSLFLSLGQSIARMLFLKD